MVHAIFHLTLIQLRFLCSFFFFFSLLELGTTEQIEFLFDSICREEKLNSYVELCVRNVHIKKRMEKPDAGEFNLFKQKLHS